MVTSVLDIPSSDWGMSLKGPGAVVQAEEDITQCIGVILFTRKGSDALRPLFGSDIYKWIDKPAAIAGPNIVREIIDAIGIWEKRAVVNRVTYTQDASGQLSFSIYMTVNATKSALELTYPSDFTYSDSSAFGPQFNNGFF